MLITHSYGNVIYDVAKQIYAALKKGNLDHKFKGRIGIGSPIPVTGPVSRTTDLVGKGPVASRMLGLELTLSQQDPVTHRSVTLSPSLHLNGFLFGAVHPYGEKIVNPQEIQLPGGTLMNLHSAKSYLDAMARDGILRKVP